jgi:hypothetical protein
MRLITRSVSTYRPQEAALPSGKEFCTEALRSLTLAQAADAYIAVRGGNPAGQEEESPKGDREEIPPSEIEAQSALKPVMLPAIGRFNQHICILSSSLERYALGWENSERGTAIDLTLGRTRISERSESSSC